ncbi:MAG: hypothetical protein AUI83_27885 [Armatimonadetes bacterium 13_1_40CM_3_65_7]|nr:MAG: hypothetical protein AUI83_27885 [Armatimonadetes bacterium 13_1_40CM_3_65_7]
MHRVLTWVGIAVAFALGYYVMALLIAVMTRRNYPGPLDDVSPPSVSRAVIGVILAAIFIVSVVPMRFSLR